MSERARLPAAAPAHDAKAAAARPKTPSPLAGGGVQPRGLTVGAPDDPLEREADRLAEWALGGSASARASPLSSRAGFHLQRACAKCEEEAKLRRAPDGTAAGTRAEAQAEAPTIARDVLATGGRPLDLATRADLEPRFGFDFSQVRIHTGAEADRAARSVDALAYTVGRNVVFRAGRYAPSVPAGRRLLAHELAHVVQQRAAAPVLRRALPASDFEIHGAGSRKLLPDGAPFRVFFDLNQAGPVDVHDGAVEGTLIFSAKTDKLLLQGYASDDEIAADPTIVDRRLQAVKDALVAGGHDATKISVKPLPAPGRIDYRRVRSVEILAPGETSVEPVKGAKATEACLPNFPVVDAAFQDAKTHVIDDFIDPVLALLAAPIAAGSAIETGLNDFFHGPAQAPDVKTNLEKIKKEIQKLTSAGHYLCGSMNDSSCAAGAIAYNDRGGHIVVCPGYVPLSGTLSQAKKDDHARNLLHEAAHSTAGLAGVVGTPPGTEDFGYRHERMIKLLPIDKQLQNSDSYGLFVLQVQGGVISDKPPVDVAGAGLDQPADKAKFDKSELAVARVQKWLTRSQQWAADEYGHIQSIVSLPAASPRKSWSGRFSKAMAFAADAGFPLTKPPALPAAGEEVKMAAINDRLKAAGTHLKKAITISAGAPGSDVAFTLGSPVALSVVPDFLDDTKTSDIRRAEILLEKLFHAMPASQVSLAAESVYAAFVKAVRVDENL